MNGMLVIVVEIFNLLAKIIVIDCMICFGFVLAKQYIAVGH